MKTENSTRVEKLEPGVRLATRDGRHLGNAIVIAPGGDDADSQLSGKRPCWVIETDFGNRLTLTEAEIELYFYLQDRTEIERWRCDRTNLRIDGVRADLNLNRQDEAEAGA